jgi:hypothetical protein
MQHSTPIWTAFITHHITSTRWLKPRVSRTKVQFGDLKKHVFSAQYGSDVARAGAHVLDFDLKSGKHHSSHCDTLTDSCAADADTFESTIRGLGDRYRAEASKGKKSKS